MGGRLCCSEHHRLLRCPHVHASGGVPLRRIVDGRAASTETLLAPGEADFARFAANFAFYAIFSAVVPTAMTKLMFVGEASQMSADSLSRIQPVMEEKPLSAPEDPAHPRGNDVRFEDVSFTYEGAASPAVDHVSFNVPSGTTLALVGPSGGGKSTCASLIPRFWDADSGRVLVGGVDMRDMDPRCDR